MQNGFSDYELNDMYLDASTEPLHEAQAMAPIPSPMGSAAALPQQTVRHQHGIPPTMMDPRLSQPPMPPPPGMGMSPHVAQQLAMSRGEPFTQIGMVEEIPPAHMLGVSVLLPALGAVAGMKYDGLYGVLGGSLFAGSLINVYRAIKHGLQGNPDDDKEAIISGTYAVAGIGASIYLFMKAYKKKHPQAAVNEDEDDGLRGVE